MKQIEQQDINKQHEPSPSLRDEAATRTPLEQNGDLKKQSQFVPDQNGAMSYVKGDYGNMSACGIEENKANQSQFQAPEPLKGAPNTKKSVAAVDSLAG